MKTQVKKYLKSGKCYPLLCNMWTSIHPFWKPASSRGHIYIHMYIYICWGNAEVERLKRKCIIPIFKKRFLHPDWLKSFLLSRSYTVCQSRKELLCYVLCFKQTWCIVTWCKCLYFFRNSITDTDGKIFFLLLLNAIIWIDYFRTFFLSLSPLLLAASETINKSNKNNMTNSWDTS